MKRNDFPTEVEIANTVYEQLKLEAIAQQDPNKVTVAFVEKRHGLQTGQLLSYRANRFSRNNCNKHTGQFQPHDC